MIGEQFNMGAIVCTITATSSFSGTEHYGFTYEYDNGKLGCGWMPVLFVHRLAGHHSPKVIMQNTQTGLYYVKGENFCEPDKDNATPLNEVQAGFVRAQYDNCIAIPA